MSEKYLDKRQRLQNKLARVVTNTGLRDYHHVDLLRKLHWLPIRSQITFKVATLCRRALNDEQPTYLASKLIPYRPIRSLQSSDWDLLHNQRAEQRPVRLDSRALRVESGTRSRGHYVTSNLHHRSRLG